MKHTKFILLLLVILIFSTCQQDKRKAYGKRKIKNTPERIINESIGVSPGANNFSVNIINSEDGLISDNVRQILFEEDSILLLADRGIIRIHKDTGRINFVFIDNNANFSFGKLINNNLYIIDKMGLYKFAKNKLSLMHKIKNITPYIAEAGDWLYLFSSNGNIYKINTDSTNLSLAKSYSNLTINHVFQNKEDILLSSENSLYNLNLTTLSLSNILVLSNDKINYALQDDEKIYLGSRTLYEYNINNREIIKIASITSNNFITFLYKEKDNLYIGKNRGLTLINLYKDPEQKEFLPEQIEILENYAVKNAYINYITKSENVIWIGSKNHGVIKYIRGNIEL